MVLLLGLSYYLLSLICLLFTVANGFHFVHFFLLSFLYLFRCYQCNRRLILLHFFCLHNISSHANTKKGKWTKCKNASPVENGNFSHYSLALELFESWSKIVWEGILKGSMNRHILIMPYPRKKNKLLGSDHTYT